MKKIIIASKSIDRSQIFRRTRIPFTVLVTSVDEDKYKKKISDPIKLVEELAKAKALNAKEVLSIDEKDAIIIAADTIIELEGEIIGKAKDEKHAFQILKKLVGKSHNLITGIAITETNNPKIIVDHDSSSVKFLNLSSEEIKGYIESGEWRGRAGAYSIREKAGLFIESIQGSSTNVMGLPMHKIHEILKKEFNLNLLQIK